MSEMINHRWNRSFCPHRVRQGMMLVALVAIACMAGDARAQIFVDYTWNNPNGGSYHTFGNWTSSSGFGGIPDSDNEAAVFNLAEQYGVFLSSDISTNSANVRDGTVLLALGTAANPQTYTLNSLRVDPGTTGGDPHLLVFDGTLNATTIRVADGGQFTLDTDVLNFDNGSATVTGAGSTWNQTTGFLRVGESGEGMLLVEDGGTVENADGAAIGRFAGSDGMATVTGDTSTLDIDATFTIGQQGTGTLLIEDGGDVENVLGRVAFGTDAVGTIIVTDEGSTWTNEEELRVGESGEGTLMIESGALVSSVQGGIGVKAGAHGSVVVTGSGSTWNNSFNVDIGLAGDGELSISDGGTVSSSSGRIGFGAGGTGSVTVDGAGSTWTNQLLTIGRFGVGTLNLLEGGNVTSTQASVGSSTDAVGTVLISGIGSSWTIEDSLFFGISGKATLLIEDGGSLSSESGRLASNSSAVATAAVQGAGSKWNVERVLFIGETGDASLTVAAGGSVSSDDCEISIVSNSTSSATISGSGSSLNTNSLDIGRSGTGTLLVEAGGNVSVTDHASIGFASPANGVATISGAGSSWTNGGSLAVGHFGTGELIISDGGTVTNTTGRLGRQVGSTGTVTVTDLNSTWVNSDDLLVGESGAGMLLISNGASVSNFVARIGLNSDSTGTVTVTGAGSKWTSINTVSVGNLGSGELNIENGGSVTSFGSSIAAGLDSTGTVTIAGIDSSWAIDGSLTVGLNGEASMSIQNGGNLLSNGGQIGLGSNAVGSVTLFGGNSTWMNTGGLAIGGSFALGNGGEGALNIHSGSTVSVTDDTVLFPDGLLRLFGGTLTTTTLQFNSGGQFIWTGGALHVGQFDGDLTTPSGGTLAPGTSTGNTLILGNYAQQAGGTLQIELGGTGMGTTFDFVNVTGDAILDGDLELSLVDNFLPQTGAEFIVFNATRLLGIFDNVANNQRLITTDGSGSFLVHYGIGSTLDPTQIVLSDFLPSLSGDFDNDGDVDGHDFLVWQRGGSPDPLGAGDLADWQVQYGAGLALTAPIMSVPESSNWLLTLSFIIACLSRRRV